MTNASITVNDLLGYLVTNKIVSKSDLVSLLGLSRHNVTVNNLELALVGANTLNEDRLATIIGELSGRHMLDGSGKMARPHLDRAVAVATGALVVDTDPLTVAFVEDTDTNRQAVVNALHTSEFETWLVTATNFARYLGFTYSGKSFTDLRAPKDLFEILDMAIEMDSSDIHLSVGIQPRVRASGALVDLAFRPLDRGWLEEHAKSVLTPRHIKELEETFSTDVAYSFGSSRFRVNVANDSRGLTMALRKLPSSIPTPDDIGLPLVIRDLAENERGMVLVTGPTGSGKSTTLAAMLNQVVQNSSRHIITLEDPIEFRFPTTGRSLINQRELGSSFNTFGEGLRDALRQDPDVILVGELRDSETIATAVTAAETGHLVFGTLHTYDAPSTIMRVVNAFPTAEQSAVRAQLSSLLKGVVSQTLVPKVGGKGRVAAHEIMINNTAIAANLRKEDGHTQLKQTMQTGLAEGMVTMEASLARLTVQGQITRDEAEFRAKDEKDFRRMLEFYTSQEQSLRNT